MNLNMMKIIMMTMMIYSDPWFKAYFDEFNTQKIQAPL